MTPPISKGSHISAGTSALTSPARPVNRSGLRPTSGAKSFMAIWVNITAVNATMIIIGEILPWASSIANIIPDIGALVAPVKPAQAPPVITYLSQAGLFFAKILTVPLPTAVPICTLGPSLPSGMPTKKVERDTAVTPMRFLSQSKRISPRRMAIEVGIPPPCISGTFLYMSDVTHAIASMTSSPTGTSLKSSRMAAYALSETLITFEAATR